jgi:hypothetical protein
VTILRVQQPPRDQADVPDRPQLVVIHGGLWNPQFEPPSRRRPRRPDPRVELHSTRPVEPDGGCDAA